MSNLLHRPVTAVLCTVGLILASCSAVQEPQLVDVNLTPMIGLMLNGDGANFLLEEHSVTNKQFLSFVELNPHWARSKIVRTFADSNYLSHWQDDFEVLPESLNCPVTNVSWFAARAYAAWAGRRLPTKEEWEYVGMASAAAADGREERDYQQFVLDWYSKNTESLPSEICQNVQNYYQVYDMHGLIWELIDDINGPVSSGGSKALFCGNVPASKIDPNDQVKFLRDSLRNSLSASATYPNLGFRCAADEYVADCCAAVPQAAEISSLPDTSIYLLDTKWQDQTGADRSLHDFSNEVVVAAMIFTHCEYACPRIVIDLQEIEKQIPVEQLDKVRWLLISMDSVRDTPDVLQDYAESKNLDTSRWTLLHGDDFAVRGIAAALGVRYKKDSNGNFAHSNIITTLDTEGRIAHQLLGLGAESSPSVAAIKAECAK
ncbi:MAG TPA: hypothetical protein EYN86_05405 [Planctomycetes bacterium]|nr:hypothetical protein [Planctomycetota bacterium]